MMPRMGNGRELRSQPWQKEGESGQTVCRAEAGLAITDGQ